MPYRFRKGRTYPLLAGSGNTIGGLTAKMFNHQTLDEWKEIIDFFDFESVSDMLYIWYVEMKWPLNKIVKKTGFDRQSICIKLHRLGVKMRSRGGPNNPTGRKFVNGHIPEGTQRSFNERIQKTSSSKR